MPELHLSIGDVHELELPGRGSAGYSWQTEVIGAEGVLAIRRAPSGPVPASEPPVSGSLPERLELVGEGEGRVRLRLELRRSWEEGQAPLEERVLDIVVS